jgi:hypothetical protein
MSLARRLQAINDSLTGKAPEAASAIRGLIAELRASGLADRALKVGDGAPRFALEATDGSTVSLESLIAHGPAILTFYRGRW